MTIHLSKLVCDSARSFQFVAMGLLIIIFSLGRTYAIDNQCPSVISEMEAFFTETQPVFLTYDPDMPEHYRLQVLNSPEIDIASQHIFSPIFSAADQSFTAITANVNDSGAYYELIHGAIGEGTFNHTPLAVYGDGDLIPESALWLSSSEILVNYQSRAIGFESIPFVIMDLVTSEATFVHPFTDPRERSEDMPISNPLLTFEDSDFTDVLSVSPSGKYLIFTDRQRVRRLYDLEMYAVLDTVVPDGIWLDDSRIGKVSLSNEPTTTVLSAFTLSIDDSASEILATISLSETFDSNTVLSFSPDEKYAVVALERDNLSFLYLLDIRSSEYRALCINWSEDWVGINWVSDGAFASFTLQSRLEDVADRILLYDPIKHTFSLLIEGDFTVLGWIKP